MKTTILASTLCLLGFTGMQAQTIMNIYQNDGTVLEIPLNTIDSITYTTNNPVDLPTLTTKTINLVTANTAVAGGDISDEGASAVTERGVCYSTSSNPTTSDSTVSSGTGTGDFNSFISGLTNNTTYYVRAYATNNSGTAYGNEISFTTNSNGSGLFVPGNGVAFDSYNYPSIILGNGQEWLAENLKTTVYANGDPIPNLPDNSQWQQSLNIGAWVNYDNNNTFDGTLGKLYNWYAVLDARNVCPTGWHVPSNAEWDSLISYLGGENEAGGKMKTTPLFSWESPNTGATNESGFSAKPGGYREGTGLFFGIGYNGIFWSSTEHSLPYAWDYLLFYASTGISADYSSKSTGNSIRCIKN